MNRPLRFLTVSYLVLATTVLFAQEGNEDGWKLKAALAGGGYDSDQEPKQQWDLIVGSYFVNGGGIGFNTPWQNKAYGSLPLGLQYDKERWRGLFDLEGQYSEPNFFTYRKLDLAVSGWSGPIETYGMSQYEIGRSLATAQAGYRLNADPSVRKFHLLAGLRSFHVNHNFESRALHNASIAQSGVSNGTAYSATASINETELERGNIAYSASGLIMGLTYEHKFTPVHEFATGMGIFSLRGKMQSTRIGLHLYSDSVRVTTNTGTATGGNNTNYLSYRAESGNLMVNGSELFFTYFYRYSPNTRFFVSLSGSGAEVRTSQVSLLLFNAGGGIDPYKDTINGETIYMRTLRYVYFGHRAPEGAGGLAFGLEYKL